MRILIVLRDKNTPLKNSVEKTIKQINENPKITFAWKNRLKEDKFKEKDLIISLGGDGTFLSASHLIINQPIFGINSNEKRSEGFLTSADSTNYEKKLKQIFSKKARTKNYSRAKAEIFHKGKCVTTKLALNEIYFGNVNPQHPSRYILKNKNKTELQRSSGILITTGTGSTAWYKAMGGKPFKKTKKQLRFKIREPFLGKLHNTKIKKGKLNSLNSQIQILSKMNHGLLSIDSIINYKIHINDKIKISLGTPLKVIQ